MLEKASFYPGQDSKEEIVLFIHRHWFSYVRWVITIFLMTIMPLAIILTLYYQGSWGGIFYYSVSSKYFIITFLSAYYLFTIAFFFTTWIEWYLDVTIVTKGHLINIRQDELFSRKVAEQSLLRVQDVSSKINGFFESIFHFGTVFVETAGEQPNFKMINIPNPTVVASTILKLHEELVENFNDDENFSEGAGVDSVEPSKKDEKVKSNISKILYSADIPYIPKKKKIKSIEKVIVIQNPDKFEKKEDKQIPIIPKVIKVNELENNNKPVFKKILPKPQSQPQPILKPEAEPKKVIKKSDKKDMEEGKIIKF